MPERKVEVTLPTGQKGQGTEVQVEESAERWSEFTMEDGTIIRAKVTLLSAVRVDGQYDAVGNPLYLSNVQPVITIMTVPDGFEKKGAVMMQVATPKERFIVNAMLLQHWPLLPSNSHVGVVLRVDNIGWDCGLFAAWQPETGCIIPDGASFEMLADQWVKERGATSSITNMMLSPSYQRIIGMGERTVPHILKRLEREGDNPDHWGCALHAITGEDPIPEEAAGDAVQIARAWLDWGRHRYAW